MYFVLKGLKKFLLSYHKKTPFANGVFDTRTFYNNKII